MSELEQTMNVSAEKWLDEQFEKFNFEGFNETDKTEVYAVFMNTMREATYELFEEKDRAQDLSHRQSMKLRKIVNLARGEPPPDSLWSTHDADLLVQDMAAKVQAGRDALMTLAKFVESHALKALIEEALREIDPRRCPNCGSVEITSSMKDEKFKYGVDGPDQVELTAEVRAFTCYICEQQWTDHTGEAARTAAVDKYVLEKRGVIA